MELTEVDSVCQLGKSVAIRNPGCRGSVCWSEIDRKLNVFLANSNPLDYENILKK